MSLTLTRFQARKISVFHWKGIDVTVERKRIKHLHLSVYPPDARVHLSIPTYLTDDDVRNHLIAKWDWVTEQIDFIRKMPIQPRREYVSGEDIYLFGERQRLVVTETNGRESIAIGGNKIEMLVHKGCSRDHRAELIKQWYRERLTEMLDRLMAKWTNALAENDVKWSIRVMRRAWGNCRTDKRRISYNLSLARVPVRCIEYVVVHELTHLAVPNHSKEFKNLLTTRLPRWKDIRTELSNFIALPIE